MGFFSRLASFLDNELENAGADPLEEKFIIGKGDTVTCTGNAVKTCVAKVKTGMGEKYTEIIKGVSTFDLDKGFDRKTIDGKTTIAVTREHVLSGALASCAVGTLRGGGDTKMLLCRSKFG